MLEKSDKRERYLSKTKQKMFNEIFFVLFPFVVTWYVTLCDATTGETIHVAFLAPSDSDGSTYNVSTSVAALIFALESIQNETGLLDSHQLNVTWYDTKCDQKNAAGKAVDIYMLGDVDMFLGPPCSGGMQAVASLASYWNLAVYGWHSGEMGLADKVTYSTLARSFGSIHNMGSMMVDQFKRFGWSRGAMITCTDDVSSAEVGDAIQESFRDAGITVTQRYLVQTGATWAAIRDILLNIQLTARIVVMSIPVDEIRKYMLVAFDLLMTSGDYVFWTTNTVPETDWRYGNESWIGTDGRDADARTAMEALFHMTIADSIAFSYSQRRTMDSWKEEALAVAQNSELRHLYPPAVMGDAYSPYLSDALYLYALVINETLEEGLDDNDGQIIFDKSKEKVFNGTTGRVLMTRDADRALNAWLLDLDEFGYFEISGMLYWIMTSNGSRAERLSVRPPRWPTGEVGEEFAPPDVPPCGFLGELCDEDDDTTGVIIGMTIGTLALCVVLLGVAFYRRKKFESQMQKMLWKVSYGDIDFRVRERVLGSRTSSLQLYSVYTSERSLRSQKSVISGGNTSLDLRGQLFARVGVYKGNYVAVRKLHRQSIRITQDVIVDINKMKEISHNNMNTFVGACVKAPNICVLWQYCSKGSLQDVIFDDNIKLDLHFKCSILADIAKGMEYLHHSRIGSHGRLKSSNIVIDSRWTCKVTDFGLETLFQGEEENGEAGEHTRYSDLFWKAPELLRPPSPRRYGSVKGDVYSFAVICKEVICRSGPYSDYDHLSPKEIIDKVREPSSDKPFRPLLTPSEDPESPDEMQQYQEMLLLPEAAWLEEPHRRPSFSKILKCIHRIYKGSTNIIDNMISMLEKYANNLEDIVAERTEQLQDEKKKTDSLLYRMLPQPVAESLKQGQTVQAEWFDDVTIYFSDVVGFTSLAALSTPMQVVDLLNDLYTTFDDIITRHDVYKVETIGDAYMIVSGLPVKNGKKHASEIANCSLDILQSVQNFTIRHLPAERLRIRIGLHTGPCCAGVVGLAMPRYCLFGDTVNTASRMESSGEAMKVHISDTTHQVLRHFDSYVMTSRGEIPIKGKGLLTTYWLHGKLQSTELLPQQNELDGNELTTVGNSEETLSRDTKADYSLASLYGHAGDHVVDHVDSVVLTDYLVPGNDKTTTSDLKLINDVEGEEQNELPFGRPNAADNMARDETRCSLKVQNLTTSQQSESQFDRVRIEDTTKVTSTDSRLATSSHMNKMAASGLPAVTRDGFVKLDIKLNGVVVLDDDSEPKVDI